MKEFFKGILFVITGIILKHIWDKYKNRITYLSYTVWHRSLGKAVSDNLFGNIKILYNDNPVSNLTMSTVIVENRSNKDIQDLNLNIFCNTNYCILVSNGYLHGSSNVINYTDEYSSLLEGLTTDASSIDAVLAKRDYKIPVLNRESKLEIQLLITSDDSLSPYVFVNCDHVGVKMKYAKELPTFWGEPQRYTAWIGSAIALFLCYPLITYIPNELSYVSVIAGTLLGIFAMVLGWVVLKTLKIIFRVIG